MESRNYPLALARYHKLLDQFPDNEAIALEYVGALLKAGNPDQARKNLLALSPKTKQMPVYSQLLAQVYSDLKQPAESHRYLAEYYYQIGQTKDAILQIRLAQQAKGLTFHMASILSDRLRFFISQEEQALRRK
jgi:predicted Zn-dependent protease